MEECDQFTLLLSREIQRTDFGIQIRVLASAVGIELYDVVQRRQAAVMHVWSCPIDFTQRGRFECAVIAWVLARSGLHGEAVAPPDGGRAPGWRAGLELARREST